MKTRKKMSNTEKSLTVLVWEHCPSTYNGSALVVLLKIAGLSEREGHAWPSMTRLALMCGMERRGLQKLTAKFVEQGILEIQQRRGHSSRFFLQVAAIRKLSSVVPAKEEAPAVTPEPAAPAPAVEDGRSLAQTLVTALRKENPASPLIPLELDDWAAKFQTLLDSGHDAKTIKNVCRFGRKHPFWEIDIQSGDVVTAVVKNFEQMLTAYKKSVEREKEKAA
jgi:hypothetical protein